MREVLKTAGGAVIPAHKGQSNVWLAVAVPWSSPWSTNFMLPELVQTSSIPWELTTGDAIAKPMDNANQTSTRRVMWIELRRLCMLEIIVIQVNS